LIGVAAVATLAGADPFQGQIQPLGRTEERGRTIPSDDRDLAFAQPGLISEVLVKNGDVVKKGQLLAKQDTQVEEAALASAEFELKSDIQLRAATAQRELAEVELKRVTELRKSGSASVTEVEKATLEVTVDKLKEELAKEETQKKQLEVDKLKKQIARMQIVCAFDGVVRKVETSVGEVADPQKPQIIVVSNNPLWVATKLPTHLTNVMKLGQTLQIRYLDEKNWREAKLIYFDPVADATEGQQLVHLELKNDDNRRAGQEVVVKLPENVAEAK
jgi:RND family efflux transporter MFP subunit